MSFPPTIFVHEFISGGGWPAGKLPVGLPSEGLAMLWSVLSDFREWGAVQTVTTLDYRIENQISGFKCKKLPADEVVLLNPGQYEQIFRSILQRCDAALIIAPRDRWYSGKVNRNCRGCTDSTALLQLCSSKSDK